MKSIRIKSIGKKSLQMKSTRMKSIQIKTKQMKYMQMKSIQMKNMQMKSVPIKSIQMQKSRRMKSTSQKMKFFINEFFSKYDQICRKLRIWSHLLKKSLMENFIFCAVKYTNEKYTNVANVNIVIYEMQIDTPILKYYL